MSSKLAQVRKERRAWVERVERFKDLSEQYDRDVAAAATAAERQQLSEVFSAARRAHREQDIAEGKRSPGMSVLTRQPIWLRWFEIAVAHEREARRAAADFPKGLQEELRAALVAVSASAHSVEALFGELVNLVPSQHAGAKGTRHGTLAETFRVALGLERADAASLRSELAWLFEQRDWAVHPYAPFALPLLHPSGTNVSAEHIMYSAQTSRRAVDIANEVFRLVVTSSPPGRWVCRWREQESHYFSMLPALLKTR